MVDFAQPLPPASGGETDRRAPDPPKRCNKRIPGWINDLPGLAGGLCDREVDVLLAVVDAGIGQSRRRRVGALSEFTLGAGGPLKPHVVFVGWIARCAECFRDDQEACYGR